MMASKKSCPGCSTQLSYPYIHCLECATPTFDLCLHCFARGLENNRHQSDHKYAVVKNDFPLFEKDWTALEETKLLDALIECGMDNWSDVAHVMQTKSRSSCELHYKRFYLENPMPPLPQTPEAERTFFPSPVPFIPCENPPRPIEGSALHIEMSGYLPARGDFTVEYDNYAEMSLKDISFTDMTDRLYTAYNKAYEHTLGFNSLDSMRVFQKLMNQFEWDMYIESWNYETHLKQCILKLKEYREAGLTNFSSAKMYDYLKQQRDKERTQQRFLADILQHLEDKWSCNQWLKKQALLNQMAKGDMTSVHISNTVRRPIIPLDIVGLPGYDKLTSKERELCSTVRLVPESYLEFRKILMEECHKLGHLRLAQARCMIKIDVNKTRKIYDFLVEEGLINKEPLN
ncbi:hypothetical protein LSH36_109g05045 [Paralvinella palmiformis]|uniref:Transcriptional adapter n=1 Tax=Paralvinella palmiformis TaxID=53620 RepID=A0AAD9K0G5_9ANNE|nr:hypothetical protein LSH36_109g05045 [Paralvinella palmiformis]